MPSPYEALFEEVPLGLMVVQTNGAIALVNAFALEMLGLPRRITERARFQEILPGAPEEVMGNGCAVARLALDDRTILLESRPFEAMGQAKLVTMRDVTDQTAIDRVKSAFVSDLLHKIRTPLTTIKSSLGALGSSRVDPATIDAGELLAMSRAETDRLVRVLDDIRDLFLVDTGLLEAELEPTDIDVRDLVEDVLRRVAKEADAAGLVVELARNGEVSPVRADPRLLRRAIQKVVENSVRYTPEGGRVSLEMHDQEDRVELVLADDGPGMGEDEEMRAFDRFFRGASAPSHVPDGIGIGLTLARDIVRLMGGEVTLETGPGLGTKVSLFLPIAGGSS